MAFQLLKNSELNNNSRFNNESLQTILNQTLKLGASLFSVKSGMLIWQNESEENQRLFINCPNVANTFFHEQLTQEGFMHTSRAQILGQALVIPVFNSEGMRIAGICFFQDLNSKWPADVLELAETFSNLVSEVIDRNQIEAKLKKLEQIVLA
jgi:GAF domain-containing protein